MTATPPTTPAAMPRASGHARHASPSSRRPRLALLALLLAAAAAGTGCGSGAPRPAAAEPAAGSGATAAATTGDASPATAATSPAAQPIAFTGATVLPMDRERRLPGHTVVVVDGRIASVAPDADADIPAGAKRIDARGKFLLPGLAEMHGHVPGDDRRQYADDVLFLYVSNGVTTVRNMAGDASHLAMRDAIAAGTRDGPTLLAASRWLGDDAKTPAAAEAKVREYHAAGFDLLKVGGLPKPGYDAMAKTAHALGIPFAGHVPVDVGLVGALDAKQASIDHLDRYVEFLVPEAKRTGGDPGFFGSAVVAQADPARIPEAVARTKAAGTWNMPTLTLVGHLASPEPAERMAQWPEMRYMPPSVIDGWVKSKREFQARVDFQPPAATALVALNARLVKALHDAGAPIALGSDAPQFFNVPGFSVHHEARMMVDAGLTPYEVIATGTREAARYFGTPGAFGVVAPGARADLLLVDADPFADVAHLQRRSGVMVRGRWMAKADIQARLSEIAARNARQ